MSEKMLVDVKSCQRCGENHAGVEFMELENATDDYDKYGTCPSTGQPIMLKIQ